MQNWESRCSDCCIGILVGQINYRLEGMGPPPMSARCGAIRYCPSQNRCVIATGNHDNC